MLNRPIGAIDPFWAPDDGTPAGGGQAPDTGQAAVASGGTLPSAPEGQVAAQAPPTGGGQVVGDGGSAEPQSPFFEYEWEDGRKDTFHTDQDLRNAWREGILRRDKFTQEQQKLAEQRKEFESRQSVFDREYNVFLEQKDKYDQMSKVLDGLSEQEFQTLLNQATRGRFNRQQQAALPPEVREEIESLKEFKQQQENFMKQQQAAEQREAVYAQLEAELGQDFQRDAVQAEIQRLKEVEPEEQMRAFAQLVHYALIGQRRPLDLARQAQAKVRQGGTPPTPKTGGSPIKPDDAGALSEAQAADLSMKEIAARAKRQAGVA